MNIVAILDEYDRVGDLGRSIVRDMISGQTFDDAFDTRTMRSRELRPRYTEHVRDELRPMCESIMEKIHNG